MPCKQKVCLALQNIKPFILQKVIKLFAFLSHLARSLNIVRKVTAGCSSANLSQSINRKVINAVLYSCNNIHQLRICNNITKTLTRAAKTLRKSSYNHKILKLGQQRNAGLAAKINIGFINNKNLIFRSLLNHLANLVTGQTKTSWSIRICKNNSTLIFFSPLEHLSSIQSPVLFQRHLIHRNIIKARINRIKAVSKLRHYKASAGIKKSIENKRQNLVASVSCVNHIWSNCKRNLIFSCRLHLAAFCAGTAKNTAALIKHVGNSSMEFKRIRVWIKTHFFGMSFYKIHNSLLHSRTRRIRIFICVEFYVDTVLRLLARNVRI